MKRHVIAVLLSLSICHLAVAQEYESDAARSSDKRVYKYNRIRIEDPAGFKKLQKTPLFSGPQPREELRSFKAVGVLKADQWLGKVFDPVAVAKGKHQIIIFQQESGSLGILETIGFWRRLLPRIEQHSKQELHGTIVFLGDGPNEFASLARDPRYAEILSTSPFLYGYSTDGREGPGTYGLNRNVKQTILLAKEGIVTHNFPFTHPHFMPDPHVLGGVAELLGVKREPLAQSLNAAEAEDARVRRAKNDLGTRE